ncbi:ketopantoate reductase family protein [Saccharospirillum impatiens]|uniref:ketopantoate reductase family protein n=1 Tax=Saccharospirillum impatiens TaxID=169438 RepID=UPI00146CA4DC|nr:2-dehydropantoate 2-reductase [Saccharospirillum impatiens]
MATILLIGPGAIGSLMAWSLQDRATIKVYAHRAGVSLPGTVESDEATHRLLWSLTDSLDGIDAVVVCCKATQIERATLPLIPQLSNVPWLVLCNGLGPQAWLSEQLPGQVLWASTTEGAGRFGDRVQHTGVGETRIGSPAQYPVSAKTENWGHWLTSQTGPLELHWEPDITSVLWRKLAINAVINPITAVHKCQNGALAEPQWQSEISALCEEIQSIARACGVQLPEALAERVIQVAKATRRNRSSMLTDIEAGRETEIDAILGPLLCAADRHGLSAARLQYWYQAVIRLHPLIR